jgi:excisionase family DNA binding protein
MTTHTPTRTAQISELLSQLAGLMAEVEQPAPPPQPVARSRVLLTVEEAAEQLGIGKTTAYALVRSGELESVLIGRLRRIHVDAVTAYASRLVTSQRHNRQSI